MFNPQEHLIYLPRKVKDPVTGQWSTRLDEYLEVKFRVLMFRQAHPSGVIETEEVCVDLEKGYARYKARVTFGEGGLATGYGTETKADFADFCERAETRAVGGALALAGFGTQFGPPGASDGKFTVRPFGGGSPLLKERLGSLRVCWQGRGAETRRDDIVDRMAKNL
jgi:hypothetical protein